MPKVFKSSTEKYLKTNMASMRQHVVGLLVAIVFCFLILAGFLCFKPTYGLTVAPSLSDTISTSALSSNLSTWVLTVFAGSAVALMRANSGRDEGHKFMAKAETLKKENRLMEAAELYSKAYVAYVKAKADLDASVALAECDRLIRLQAIQTVFTVGKDRSLIGRMRAEVSKLQKVTADNKTPNPNSDKALNLYSFLNQLYEGNLDAAAVEALKIPEIETDFMGIIKSVDVLSLNELADRLGYSLEATLKLLAKNLEGNTIEGYITIDQKTYLSREYIRNEIRTQLGIEEPIA